MNEVKYVSAATLSSAQEVIFRAMRVAAGEGIEDNPSDEQLSEDIAVRLAKKLRLNEE